MKNVNNSIQSFQNDLKILKPNEIFRKYIVDEKCYILNETKQMQLKSSICDKFHIDYNNVIIVGSGKLGFSIKPNKRYVEFGEDSDIDIAIISPKLFEEIWDEVTLYIENNISYPKYPKFCEKLSQNGWIRPDYLPQIKIKNDWFDYFRLLTNSKKFSDYNLTAGLYYNYKFLENYQLKCIKQCKENL